MSDFSPLRSIRSRVLALIASKGLASIDGFTLFSPVTLRSRDKLSYKIPNTGTLISASVRPEQMASQTVETCNRRKRITLRVSELVIKICPRINNVTGQYRGLGARNEDKHVT